MHFPRAFCDYSAQTCMLSGRVPNNKLLGLVICADICSFSVNVGNIEHAKWNTRMGTIRK